MAKFEEAQNRIHRNMFACKVCKSKIRADSLKVSQGKVSCRKCGSTALRPLRKK